jgi:uncharacterized membrane-anchored protein
VEDLQHQLNRRSNSSKPADHAVTGPVRPGRRTKELTKRLEPGDVAVIDHVDLDRVAAEGLVEARVSAVINGSASITGRYPNIGPLLLLAAGIVLVDSVGEGVFDALGEGESVSIIDGGLYVRGQLRASGTRQSMATANALIEQSKAEIGLELQRFAENTLEYMRAEQFLLLESPEVPDLTCRIQGRHVLIVVRGDQFKEDLAALKGYIEDRDPIIIAVDGGADAVLRAGHRPHIIIGDFDSVSSESLHCGAQLIVHAFPDGRAPGAQRLRDEGVEFTSFALAGTSEDVAMLLAFEKGAELIVAVGTHVNLVDFLDKGRPGMASTFLTRLKVGPILVDAKGVNKLYEPRIRKRDLTLLVVACVLALIVVMGTFPVFRIFWSSLWLTIREAFR